MHPHDAVVRLAVLLVLLIGPGGAGGDQRRLAVGAAGHQRRDRGGDVAALVGVVGETVGHQQGAEVGVAEAELAEAVGVLGDLLGRVAGEADDDLLGEEDDVDGVLEFGAVEAAVLAAELHQVEGGEVAGRVVDVHVLAAWVGGVDPARLRAGVPAVDDRVVLDARVGAAPGGVGDLVHQLARVERLHRLAGAARGQLPVLAGLDRLHELVGDPDRVVGVLVLDRGEALAVDRHVEAGVAQRRGLLLLVGLAPDEVLDVRVVDVEDDHLRRAAGLAAGLDRPRPGVGAAHEGDGTAGGATLLQRLHRAADVGEVDAGAGAAAEDLALFGVPVEDRLHRCLRR